FNDPTIDSVNYTPFLTRAILKPDLIVGTVGNPPATAQPGQDFEVASQVVNIGAGMASASNVGFYLSPTPIKGLGAVKLLGALTIINLASGANASGQRTVTVPRTTPLGAYYLIACANDSSRILERTKANNCTTSTTQVTIQ
ncbi:MAG TPA: CARDB domain-containing protein, partial [Chloroflexota bacterium]|nr:CARDB domain-containing protein [Chloroflexota bacterium]